MQEFQVVQTIVLPIVLVEVTADKMGDMDEARVNKGRRGVTKNDGLEFRDGKEGSELDKVGNKLKPAGRDESGRGGGRVTLISCLP